jgi:hypothetical protein
MKKYNTSTFAALIGVSARQLQLWDENGFLRPLRVKSQSGGNGMARVYTIDHLPMARKLAALRLYRLRKPDLKTCLGLNWRGIIVLTEPKVIGTVLLIPARWKHSHRADIPVRPETKKGPKQ